MLSHASMRAQPTSQCPDVGALLQLSFGRPDFRRAKISASPGNSFLVEFVVLFSHASLVNIAFSSAVACNRAHLFDYAAGRLRKFSQCAN
jgi:hypothetical protein